MASKNLSSFLSQARAYSRQGTAQETSLLYLLKELEPLEKVWSSQYVSWPDFLTTEQLVSRHRYKGFKAATSVFSKSGMDKFGVSACILMAAQPKAIRTKVIREATAWQKEYMIPLTGQRVTSIINQVAPERAVKKKPSTRSLRAHIKRLEAMLVAKGVKDVPTIQKTTDVTAAAAEFMRARQVFQGLVPAQTDSALVKTAMTKASITGDKKRKAA